MTGERLRKDANQHGLHPSPQAQIHLGLWCVHGQRSQGPHGCAIQKAMAGIDLGVELGAKVYVFRGGREGVESDAAKSPLDGIKRYREAMNVLCGYVRDQDYDLRFALEPKPNDPRGDLWLRSTWSSSWKMSVTVAAGTLTLTPIAPRTTRA